MSIKLLDKNVINQISAGEVVEKPASVVKELVENSIDAGANNIEIEIKNGGISYISVKDDGCGINANEVKLAFMPHATSKLEKIEDLNSLHTMGFRGEALATISAVSKVTMVTKTNAQDVGIKIHLEGGEETSSCDVACVTGTKIEVENLFYNTPARLKFLRKPKTEENDITNFIEKLILANSNISFKYIVDGKLIYNTLGGSILDNIYTIYGKELAGNMLEVDFNLDNYCVKGYISKPEFAKANRTYQTLFVNGRFCNNPLVSTSVANAYENFTMKGKFPVYILYLTMPIAEVDVNVHPNKLEVKFENTQKIYRVFNDAVCKTLYDFNHIRNVHDDDENNYTSNLDIPNQNVQELEKDEGVSYSNENENANFQDLLDSCSKSIQNTDKNTGTYEFRLTNNVLPQVDIYNYENKIEENFVEDKPQLKDVSLDSPKPQFEQEDFKAILKLEYKLVGVVFNTYLILEFEDKMYLIDQHAAHERQRYDAIMAQINSNTLKVQDLLVPYIIKVSQSEANFLNDNIDTLKSFGIDICEFGYNTYKVSSVPLIISDMNLDDFFADVFDNLLSFAKSPQETIKPRFMQMACKSAVKGGDVLSDLEINTLLNKIKTETEVLLCPHGRPIVVEITKKQIEKWFKRIV